MAGPSTAMDALLAELVGDVGRLHDAIKALPEHLAPTVGAMLEAGKQLQQRAESLTKNAKDQHDAHAQRVVATYAQHIGHLVEQRVEAALRARLGNHAQELERAIARTNDAAARYIEAARSPWLALGGAWMVAILISCVGGIVATLLTLYAVGVFTLPFL